VFIDAALRSRSLHGRWVSAPSTKTEYKASVERSRIPSNATYLVCTSDGGLAGVINASEIVLGAFRSAYLGYYAFVPHAGHGYMREGLVEVIRLAFGKLKLHRLEANIQPANERSIGLVRSLGFEREGYSPRYLKIAGRWRDHERWALRTESWSAKAMRRKAASRASRARVEQESSKS
jgi:ribosomal-protein-alanine N-acetyltransferase